MTDPWSERLVEFGRRLRGLRKAAGLGLVELAAEIGSTKSTLSELERGDRSRVPDRRLVERYVKRCVAALDDLPARLTVADVLAHHSDLSAERERWGASPRPAPAARRVVLQGAVLVEQPDGDAVIDFSRGPFDVAPAPDTVPELTVEQARARPSRLLQPRFAVVPFVGRDDERNRLDEWLNEAEPVSVRLLHAAGGQGKTRLADRVVADRRRAGWAVWQVRHSPTAVADDRAPTANRVTLPRGSDVLVVVDYGDRWPSDDLLTFVRTMQQLAQRRGVRARVLLLGRTARNWWPAVVGRLDTAYHLDASGQWPLAPLAGSLDARLSMFHTAAAHFARRLGAPVDQAAPTPPHDLDRAEYAQVLAVHMAALAAVDAHRRDETPPTELVSVSDYLLCREYAAWDRLHATRTGFTRAPVMGRLAYVATLAGSLPRPHARVAVRRTDLAESAETADRLIDDHLACYPSTDPRAVFEPLHPDRLGEDLVGLTTPGHPHLDLNWQADDWATAATGGAQVLSAAAALVTDALPDAAVARAWAPAALAVLAESAHRYPHLSTEVLNPLLAADPHLLLVAGPAAATRLTELPGLDVAVLEAVEAVLPQQRDVGTDVAATAVVRRLAEHRLATEDDPARRADLHGDLSVRLDRAGQYAEGLAHAEQAVAAARAALRNDPTPKRSARLATWLNSQSLLLARAGRRKDALAVAEEAAEVHRSLLRGAPDDDLPGLANALTTLAKSLAELGRHEEALVHGGEAADVYRGLVAAGGREFTADLALALHNIAASSSDLGRDVEALAAARESVELYRALAAERPDEHLPDLADALQNLPAYLAVFPEERDAAVRAAEDSVRLYRELVEINPAPFRPQLAGALCNLATACTENGLAERALTAVEEAVDIQRDLVESDPDAHQPDLALSLNGLARALSDNGHRHLALEVAAESVAHYRHLATVDPLPFTSDLAMALYNQASHLSESGQPDDAVGPAEEAVACYRRLVADGTGVHDEDLADAVHNLAFILGETGRHEEALRLAEEAVRLNTAITEEDEDREPFLAVATSTRGRLLVALGRADEAVRDARAAVGLLRRAGDADPDLWKPFLSGALTTLALALSRVGDTDEADKAALEAVDIVRDIERTAPDSVTPHMRLAEAVLAGLRG